MKKVVGLMMAILIVAMGCAGIAEERKTIAYSTLGVDSDYWSMMERGVAQACEDLGYDYVM